MDAINVALSGLTTPDRADRARAAWAAYSATEGGELWDLITDLLHLADVDNEFPDSDYVLDRAVANHQAEAPTWPVPLPKAEAICLAQVHALGQDWVTVGAFDCPRAAADSLRSAMETVGFQPPEIPAHVDDLMDGRILTSNCGFGFRVTISVGFGGDGSGS
ncbi:MULTISPECIES: hypothetical protein [Streptomyces]|uniref:hypothetical protein n=1 Tax=Streptomyces TaxID=1883 RepID=UPI001361C339|nr:hypothetical protein [Streptomyces sp. SID724]